MQPMALSDGTAYVCWFCSSIDFWRIGYVNEPPASEETWRIELQHLLEHSQRPVHPCLCCTGVVKTFRERLQNQDKSLSFFQLAASGRAWVTWKFHKIETERNFQPEGRYEVNARDLWRLKVVLSSELDQEHSTSLFIHRSSNQDGAHRWQGESDAKEGQHLARTRPLILDRHLLRQWKADCTSRHGPGCRKPSIKVYSHSRPRQVGKSDITMVSPPLSQDSPQGLTVRAALKDQTAMTRLDGTVYSAPVPLRKSLLTQQLSRSLQSFTSSERSPRPLRYIDVTRRCLTKLEEIPSYVALSYVWGHSELPQLSESNLEDLSREGALIDDSLPKTIADAITVTEALDEKCMWVDCLCIMQSHDAEKQNIIRNMHEIYARASVSIVAACGANANARLPGLTQGSRNPSPTSFEIQGVPLVVSLDPSPAKWWFGDTPYLHRGWTFQEKALSPRCLIFTQEQVYWECRRSLWCEDRAEESPWGPSLYEKTFTYGHSYKDPYGPVLGSNEQDFMEEYCKMVSEYTERFLTYEQDILAAFNGILGMFNVAEAREFIWALPISCLAQSLSWNFRSEPKRRQSKIKLLMSNREMLQCSFPSWSWVGWIGAITPTLADPWKAELVTFYFVDNNFEVQRLRDEEADLNRPRQQNIVADAARLSISPKLSIAAEAEDWLSSTHWRPSPWNVAQRSPIRKSDIPEHILRSQDLPSFLFCHTSVATLPVDIAPSTDCIVIDGDRDEVLTIPVAWSNGVAYRLPVEPYRIPFDEWMVLPTQEWK
jgi:Heterokaryon incompatibility protein (HET)